jgi:tetratricopeptide (TPR) repeat protein
MTKDEIKACTLVVKLEEHIKDKNILVKAHLRRGLAYETLEKYKDAKNDMTRVKELQPANSQASQGLTRIKKALASMENEGNADKIFAFKDEGTALFKSKDIDSAQKKFGEAIRVYKEDPENLAKDKNLKLVITQCFTNRALCYHQLGRQIEALSDADYVVNKLDALNVKALYRRGYAQMFLENYEEALKDF